MLISQDTGMHEFYIGDEHYIYTDGKNEIGGLMLIIKDAFVEIYDVRIAYRFQNQGHGTHMMTEIINRIKEKYPSKKIGLYVSFSNKIALHLYEKLGFMITKVDPTGLEYSMELNNY